MAYVPPTFQLDRFDSTEYIFIQCLFCHGCYRYGLAGVREGRIRCPLCSTATFNPHVISKIDYYHWLQYLKKVGNLQNFQRENWDSRNGTDEAYQRR